MSVTMKEIAAKLGISQAIVSLVLNKKDAGRVSECKRQKILDMASCMNYSPNMSAVQLRGKSSKMIGVIGSFGMVPVHGMFLWRLSMLLKENGYHDISIDIRHNRPDEERAILRDLTARGVDGIILAETSLPESELVGLSIPLLKVLPNIKDPDVVVDLRYGASSLVDHLVWHGHSRIAMLSMFAPCPLRRQGYLDALRKNSIDAVPAWTVAIKNSSAVEDEIMRLIKKEKITAFFCINDVIAATLIKFLQSRGLRVPKDIAVTGFDGLSMTRLTTPAITTAVQPMFRLAEKTAAIILDMIDNNMLRYGNTPFLLKPEIQFGESCGCKNTDTSISFEGCYGFSTIEGDREFDTIYKEEQESKK